tara:strand:+ start:3710 stop:4564 length:855 start_codon:yes stop_codon:yes gene_type:complete
MAVTIDTKITTVADVVNRYLNEHINFLAIDHKRPASAWRQMKPHLGSVSINKLTGATISSYMRKRNVSPGTINRELGVLNSALRWANAQGYIDRLIFVPRMPATPPRQRWLTEEECSSLLSAAREYPHVYAFVAIALLTGQRKEAILSLLWEQVRWNEGHIDFNQDDGLSNRRKGRAIVPISTEMEQLLRSIQSDSLYVVNNNGRRVRDFRKTWEKIVRKAGLEGVTPHTIRHTVATQLVRKGVPIIEVAKLLGHKDSRVTEKVYAKFAPDYLKNVVDNLSIAA